MEKKVKEALEKQHYKVFGHSGVQICRWAKKSLLDEGECYKQKFYGIKSHECCQMSPSIMWCQNQCMHCWRAIELNLGEKIDKIEEPERIIDDCILAQRKLLTGFGGNDKANRKKLQEAQEPKHFAISLSGEPTLYPKLAELILELKKRKKTSFLVTNGLNPSRLAELDKKKALPTQLYISFNYPSEEIFRKLTQNKNKESWKKFLESLKLMKKLKTRRVLRMTLVRELNMSQDYVPDYAKLAKLAQPDFIEVKGYMAVGHARERLGYDKMPTHPEIQDFGKSLAKEVGYKVLDEKEESRIVLLGKDRKKMKIT